MADYPRNVNSRRGAKNGMGEACGKPEWQVHAYCLMRNHFHPVVETPQPNLVFGMKWLLGVCTKQFNIRHKLCGHLFAGRHKALVVDGIKTTQSDQRVTADFKEMHLRVGIDSLCQLINQGVTVKHLRS